MFDWILKILEVLSSKVHFCIIKSRKSKRKSNTSRYHRDIPKPLQWNINKPYKNSSYECFTFTLIRTAKVLWYKYIFPGVTPQIISKMSIDYIWKTDIIYGKSIW